VRPRRRAGTARRGAHAPLADYDHLRALRIGRCSLLSLGILCTGGAPARASLPRRPYPVQGLTGTAPFCSRFIGDEPGERACLSALLRTTECGNDQDPLGWASTIERRGTRAVHEGGTGELAPRPRSRPGRLDLERRASTCTRRHAAQCLSGSARVVTWPGGVCYSVQNHGTSGTVRIEGSVCPRSVFLGARGLSRPEQRLDHLRKSAQVRQYSSCQHGVLESPGRQHFRALALTWDHSC
jgi:hypothetical protein